MASMTKEELRNALVAHGVTDLPPQSAKKDELIALYDEYVAPTANGSAEFSSDDEVVLNSSPTKRASNISKASKVSSTSKASKASTKSPKKKSESDGLVVDDVDIDALDDDELFEKLREFGVEVGPIVASTRPFYKKKLAMVMRGESMNQTNGSNGTNGTNGTEFSDTDQETEPEEEVVVEPRTRRSASSKKNSTSSASPKKSATKSPVSSKSPISSMINNLSGLRQRQNMSDETDTGKLTPTPRRSIHSYKVTETTKQVITKNRDGTETKNISRTVEKTENGQKVENKGWNKTLVTLIKVVLFLAIIGGIAAAVLMNKDNTITFDQIEDAVKNAAHAAADKAVEEKEEIVQNTIGDV